MAFDLTGKTALVTGGGRGIGAATVRCFVAAGARVVIANRTIDVAEALAAELGPQASALPLTGLSRATLKELVDDAAAALGGLDILVHNAGGCPWATIDELDEQKLEAALDVNLKACFWLTQAALPRMRQRGWGRIIITSSVSARVAFGGGSHYSAAKAGVNAFIRGAAFELARDGITVNGVEPGFIAKPGRGRLNTPGMIRKIGAYIPMGHMGEADDIAHAMLYLASEESKYMTGQTIVVDGGSTLPETGFAVESMWERG
jgi:3-oxoacyl-[acyl-carrier protein] reductase